MLLCFPLMAKKGTGPMIFCHTLNIPEGKAIVVTSSVVMDHGHQCAKSTAFSASKKWSVSEKTCAQYLVPGTWKRLMHGDRLPLDQQVVSLSLATEEHKASLSASPRVFWPSKCTFRLDRQGNHVYSVCIMARASGEKVKQAWRHQREVFLPSAAQPQIAPDLDVFDWRTPSQYSTLVVSRRCDVVQRAPWRLGRHALRFSQPSKCFRTLFQGCNWCVRAYGGVGARAMVTFIEIGSCSRVVIGAWERTEKWHTCCGYIFWNTVECF